VRSDRQLVSHCPVLVLAGGLGTRLRSCYDYGPKVLAPIGDRCFLDYLFSWLRDCGIENVVLCIGYKGNQVSERIGDGHNYGLNVFYSSEEVQLGTAGALKQAEHFVRTDSFFAMNGDSFLDVDLAAMYRYHNSHTALGTIALARQSCSKRYGNVLLTSDQEIAGFTEKYPPVSHNHAKLINGGVYLLRKHFLTLISSGQSVSLEKEVFPRLTDGRLRGFVTSSYFIDIGVPTDYARAQTELPERFQYDHSSQGPSED
jgi:D-glycero-alpha-D-manno-heptose 1-phosphate guanylyltransferase